MIIEQIRRIALPGTVIPKPDAKADFKVKGWGRRRGECALIYFVPNHENPRSPYENGITESEWEQAYQQIIKNGEFSRRWFEQNMEACNDEGGCNFTTIGGIFELLGIAYYERPAYMRNILSK